MNIEEFNVLVELGEVNLAAAYAILINNGESALLRNFEDMINITNRIKIAEKLIEKEKDSAWREKIKKRIVWYKTKITELLINFKGTYASMIMADRAKLEDKKEFYNRVVKVIDSKDDYDSFYAWFDAINSVV